MRHFLIQLAFRFLGIHRLYRQIVVQDRLRDIRPKIRADLVELLTHVNGNNPFFFDKFTSFLESVEGVDDDTFFQWYATLPALSKQDYADAGMSVMPTAIADQLQNQELLFNGKPWQFLNRLRNGRFLMPMATGGSTSSPLTVRMTKQHMFSMLFTFFKCWYRMGWRPGDRMLVFYPRNTYNIDDMAKFNRFSAFTGFRIQLFSRLDQPTIADLVDEINRFRPRIFLVFPSPMNMIAHTIRKEKLSLNHHPEMINVSGETFFDCQRKNIEDVFSRSRVEDSYGSVELGEIAHETRGGLEIFANAAYVETEPNAHGQPEMIVTRLGLTDFPFIRYRMRDVADVRFITDDHGNERFVITSIEGKDSNFILSDRREKFYPSFFNRLVNDLNDQFDDSIVEIKVHERDQKSLDVQFIVRQTEYNESISVATQQILAERISPQMTFDVQFVDFIDHDYRRKYRVIERIGDVEYAGGIVGDTLKLANILRDANGPAAAEHQCSSDGRTGKSIA